MTSSVNHFELAIAHRTMSTLLIARVAAVSCHHPLLLLLSGVHLELPSTFKKQRMTEKSNHTFQSTSCIHIEPQQNPVLARKQNKASAIQCWAHTRTGKRCQVLVTSREGEPIPIPYCNRHLSSGDGALKVVQHPFAGRCLVARYDLPKGYRMAFIGARGRCLPSDREDRAMSFYPPDPQSGSNYIIDEDGSKRRKVNNYNGALNPTNTGDLLQYASCPGPSERQNLKSNFQYFGVRNGRLGGLEFITTEQVPQNTQLLFWYGAGWWSTRGIPRLDVGTNKYPAPKRKQT